MSRSIQHFRNTVQKLLVMLERLQKLLPVILKGGSKEIIEIMKNIDLLASKFALEIFLEKVKIKIETAEYW